MMQQLFLYRLYQHHKLSFVLVVVFMFSYAFFFSKKMDMILFPHNSMFAYEAVNDGNSISTYGIRVNGKPVHFSNKAYWKKDFIESSLQSYAGYLTNGRQAYIQQYLAQKQLLPAEISSNLFPAEKASASWPLWLLHFTGVEIPSKAKIEFYKYSLSLQGKTVVVKDSSLIFSQQINNF